MITKKNLTKGIILSIVIGILITTSVYAYNIYEKNTGIVKDPPESKSLTQYSRDQFTKVLEIENKYASDKTLAVKINEIEIYRGEIEARLELLKLNGNKDISYDDAIKNIATNRLLLVEAKKRGINISFEEGKKDSLKEKEIFGDSSKTPEDQRIAILEYIKALGISEDEYWNEYHAKESIDYLAIQALSNQVINDAQKEGKFTNKNASNTEIYKEKNEYLKNYKEDIFKSSKKQVIDEELKSKTKITN